MASKPSKATEQARARRAETLRDVRRNMIVEAAKAVFTDAGLEGASMRLIAAEAGCTTGAIYPYFAGKEEIYGAVLGETLARLHDAVAGQIAAQKSATAAAQAGVIAFFDYYRARPEELALGLYLFNGLNPKGLRQDLDRALNAQLKAVFDLIEAQYRKAGRRDAPGDTAEGVAQAIGALMLERTGRMRLWGRSGREILLRYIAESG